MATWTIEMFWNCPACGQKKNPGMTGKERESLRCVNCGREKQESDAWLMMPDDPTLQPHLSDRLDRAARAGTNWSCEFCKSESRATSNACEVCGAGRHAPPDTIEPDTDRPPPPAESTAAPALAATATVKRSLPSRAVPWRSYLAGAAAAAALVWFFVWLSSPIETNATVTDVHWSRSETLLERHDYSGAGWQDQEPSGVFSESCQSMRRGTHDCRPHDCNCRQAGYDCRCSGGDSYSCGCRDVCRPSCSSNRNGSATCSDNCYTSCRTCYTPRRCDTCYRTVCNTCYDQCPTMVNWCSYQYHQWDTIDQHALERHDSNPAWPQPQFVAHTELQRVQRSESYHVLFRDDTDASRTWNESYGDAGVFARFRVHQRWHVRYNHAGGFTALGQIR